MPPNIVQAVPSSAAEEDGIKSLSSLVDSAATDDELISNLVSTMTDASSSAEEVSNGRRRSRSSIKWFQEQTADALIGPDGKLNDEYIVQRQSLNKPATLQTIPQLADLTNGIAVVDGWVLTQLFLSGYAKMHSKIDQLNKINVFPIADGDTGANMKVCLKLPIRNLLLEASDSILAVASNMAADVLLNGQGNSGTILSHFFVSFAEQIKATEKEELTIDEFAACLTAAGAKMDDAVPDPVEGTLVSVARDCCNLDQDGPFATLYDLLEVWSAKANAELAKTPDQLCVDGVKVLKKAGVVDSGAQGFVYLIFGMVLAARGELPEASDPKLFESVGATNSEEIDIHVDHTVTDSNYQFCTEAVVLLKDGQDKATVLESIRKAAAEDGLGDSIACVGAPAKEGGDMVKIHIHSNNPQQVFDHLRQFSRNPKLRKEKVEDMWAMRKDTHGDYHNCFDLSGAKFTIVGLSSLVLPPSQASPDLGTFPCFLVPSTTQEPIDCRFVSDADTCMALNMQRHKDTAIRYTTATPNPMQAKVELLAALAKGKPVLVFIMSKDKRVSAFGRNVMAAIDMLLPEQRAMITVLVHGNFHCERLFLQEAMECAKNGKTIDEAYASCKELADRNSFFLNICSSSTVEKVVAWRPGLFPKDFTVSEDQFYAFGAPPKIREGRPLTDFERASTLFALLGTAPTLSQVHEAEVKRIRDTLKPGQVVSSLMVSCTGRPDYGHAFVKKLKEANVPIQGEATVFLSGFAYMALSKWGDMTVTYKVIERRID